MDKNYHPHVDAFDEWLRNNPPPSHDEIRRGLESDEHRDFMKSMDKYALVIEEKEFPHMYRFIMENEIPRKG